MKREDRTDEQIVRQVLQGSVESFRTIVERYQRVVFGIGMRFFKNRDDAGDFAQEVFVKAYRSLSSFAGKAPFRYWLTRIAYRHGIDRTAAVENAPAIPEDVPSPEPSLEHGRIRTEIRELLQKAVARLPERYRICVDMFFFLGLTYAEISEITGFPVNTVKSHVMRAKAMLRDGLKGTIAEDYHDM